MDRTLLKPIVILAIALTTLVACGPAAPSTPPDSGIRGLVMLAPTCAVQQENDPDPCATTYAATLEIHDSATERLVATVSSGADGRFEVRLPAGTYDIRPQSAEVLPIGTPVDSVEVEAGRFTEVQVDFDSGIR